MRQWVCTTWDATTIAKYTKGKKPLVDYSMSNVLVIFDEYLSVLLMNIALVEEFREKNEWQRQRIFKYGRENNSNNNFELCKDKVHSSLVHNNY